MIVLHDGVGDVAGTDEVGRGCLAGPVVAAIVILDPGMPVAGLADSKTLSPARREQLAQQIKLNAKAWAVGRAEASEVDRINVFHASLLAMRRAYHSLPVKPGKVLVDGKHCPDIPCPCEAVVAGDQTVAAISAASILAKVARDREMAILDVLYPGYVFASHKAYPTELHQSRLMEIGPSPIHRYSFSPVAKAHLEIAVSQSGTPANDASRRQ
jgi:ribonuclease HII